MCAHCPGRETSIGRYPTESVDTMSRIIHAAEASFATVPPLNHVPHTKRGVLAGAARDIGERLEAKALVAFTQSGDTAPPAGPVAHPSAAAGLYPRTWGAQPARAELGH